MAKKPIELMWGIFHPTIGFYTDFYLTRKQARAQLENSQEGSRVIRVRITEVR